MRLLTANTHVWLAGALGAAIMACVMATDSQILALGTMFTQDIFAHYGGRKRFGERVQVWTGRAFVIAITVVAYVIALHLKDKAGIFELAIRFAFSGFAALAPIMLAALFWKRSTKWGALAATLWVLAAMLGTWYLHEASASLPGAVVKVTVEIQASVPCSVWSARRHCADRERKLSHPEIHQLRFREGVSQGQFGLSGGKFLTCRADLARPPFRLLFLHP